ncbi:hypothetical protein [Mycoplasma mycoides]|nr:hypothetical protein [Mycoplasma mycoides]ADK70123.1 conserved hypothetical protein [Mycoplasma mycoides subsp. mycoides SC str. Gladysdale]AIZ55521.1 hypothetical protein mycmycITA_00700 [Mycoplasma mycoides subsp. mycoides]AMK56448.1 hypothetical protein MSCT144_05440 [Mycoplasma mycoides subsp. mycoides]KJQ46330.1 hypothetical protein TS59_0727 [Mycoplasma mycoides subsp. mycoides]KJQ47149.1 hypothetical protein TS60_0745 [Mycoplasma mycoides subsp. mycoides]
MLQELKKLNKSIEKFAKQLNKSKVKSNDSDKIDKAKRFKLFDFNKFNNTNPSFEIKQSNLSLQNNQNITDKKIGSKLNKLNIFKKKDKEVKK